MAYISFWRFGKEEQWEREKEIFLDELRLLVSSITKNKEKKELYTKANETELAKTLKQIIAKKIMMILISMIQSLFLCFFWDYLIKFLQKVKKNIFEKEFNYDNWKNKSKILCDDCLMKCIKFKI